MRHSSLGRTESAGCSTSVQPAPERQAGSGEMPPRSRSEASSEPWDMPASRAPTARGGTGRGGGGVGGGGVQRETDAHHGGTGALEAAQQPGEVVAGQRLAAAEGLEG